MSREHIPHCTYSKSTYSAPPYQLDLNSANNTILFQFIFFRLYIGIYVFSARTLKFFSLHFYYFRFGYFGVARLFATELKIHIKLIGAGLQHPLTRDGADSFWKMPHAGNKIYRFCLLNALSNSIDEMICKCVILKL